MATLRPVEPRGRRAAARGWLVAVLIAATIATAVAKPWTWREEPPPDAPTAERPVPTPVAVATAVMPTFPRRTPGPVQLPLFRSDIFSFVRMPPAWEVLVGVLIGDFSLAGHTPVSPREPQALDLAGDPLELGAADHIVALAINHPTGVPVHDLRLWRFAEDGRRPFRVPLLHLPAPKRNSHLEVIGLRLRDGSDELTAWPPGLYRLDLLVGGDGTEVVSLALRAGPNSDGRPERGRQPPGTTDLPGLVAEELPPGSVVTRTPSGDKLRAFAGSNAERRCLAGEVWHAATGTSVLPCRPYPLMTATSLGVAMPARRGGALLIEGAVFRRLDPVPDEVGMVAIAAQRGSVAVTTTDGRPFAEGTYELASTVNGRSMHWYFEVVPGGGELPRIGATH